MKGILHMNMCIFLCVHLHRHTHKTCSKHLWLNHWICFGHNILHKPSEIPLKELEWSCLSCVRGNSREQLGRGSSPRPVPAAFVPRRGAVPGGKGHPGLEPWPGTAHPLGIGAVPLAHTCGHPGASPVLRLFQFFSYSVHPLRPQTRPRISLQYFLAHLIKIKTL